MKKYLFLLVLIALTAFMFNPVPINSSVCMRRISTDLSTIDFTNTLVGNKSIATNVTITNTSDCSYDLNNPIVSLSGDSGEFNVETNTCPATLPYNSSCQVGISFEPSATGNFSASLTLTTNEITFADQVALSGTGITDNTALLIVAAASRDNSSGCDATASTGAAGGKSFGPAALGFIVIMGLVLGVVAIRRSTRKRG